MLPYGRQTIEDDDIEAVIDTLKSDFLTTGPKVGAFEKAFCKHTNAEHTVVCANGTAALHLAAMALGLGEGDAAIVPGMTFPATANAARFCGAEVVFSDVDSETGLMGPDHLEQALKRVPDELTAKAVFPVHLNGQSVDQKGIKAVADRHGLSVVIDSCHALGGTYEGSAIGSCAHADMETFSFHPVKTIAMGEGGAITTNDPAFAEKMRCLRTHGMTGRDMKPEMPFYNEMHELGYNYRASDIQCALGLSQLGKLDRFARRRGELVALYDEKIEKLAPTIKPVKRMNNGDACRHLYAVLIDFEALGATRADFMTALKEKGVGTQVHYIPVHQQPYYRNRYGELALEGAERYYKRVLSLPLYPAMEDEDVSRVISAMGSV